MAPRQEPLRISYQRDAVRNRSPRGLGGGIGIANPGGGIPTPGSGGLAPGEPGFSIPPGARAGGGMPANRLQMASRLLSRGQSKDVTGLASDFRRRRGG